MSDQAPPVEPVAPGERPPLPRSRPGGVASAIAARVEDLRLAVTALGSHRLRSGLTLLGIVIGVFTVVTMMSLLNGLQTSINKNMGGLGAGVFQIQKLPNFNFGEIPVEIQRRKNITLAQAMELRGPLPPQAGARGVGGRQGLQTAPLAVAWARAHPGSSQQQPTHRHRPPYNEAETHGARRGVHGASGRLSLSNGPARQNTPRSAPVEVGGRWAPAAPVR